jgi:uncharacterized damage-inducible protein DinB
MLRPLPEEIPSDYLRYYVDLVHGEDPIKVLEQQQALSQKLFKLMNEEQGNYRYAEGKWTVKEVIGHLCDTERIFAYRALAIARGEKKDLPGYEQDDYVVEGRFNHRTLTDVCNEFRLVRDANIALFKSFDEQALLSKGFANGKEISTRALIFVTAGHEIHHLSVIKNKYLV